MTKKHVFALVLALAIALPFWAAAQTPDTAKDPVCGMTVKTAGAKWTYDFKGTTYYFCSEGCKTSFAAAPEKYLFKALSFEAPAKPMGGGMGMMHGQMQGQAAAAQAADTAIDPVCGMSVKKAGAKWTYDFKGTTYYFCSEGCKTSFAATPEKFLEKSAAAKPMAGGMGMMHGEMQGQMQSHMQGQMQGMMRGRMPRMMGRMMHGRMKGLMLGHMQSMMHGQAAGQAAMAGCACGGGDCPMMMADVEKKVENTKTGVVITLSSKNAETVKKIQEHAAKAKTDKGGEAKTPAAMKEGACSCPGCKK